MVPCSAKSAARSRRQFMFLFCAILAGTPSGCERAPPKSDIAVEWVKLVPTTHDAARCPQQIRNEGVECQPAERSDLTRLRQRPMMDLQFGEVISGFDGTFDCAAGACKLDDQRFLIGVQGFHAGSEKGLPVGTARRRGEVIAIAVPIWDAYGTESLSVSSNLPIEQLDELRAAIYASLR